MTTPQKKQIALILTITLCIAVFVIIGKKMIKVPVPNLPYFQGLKANQVENITYIMEEMQAAGIHSPLTKAAILAVISKESKFVPQGEISYARTSNARIRSIFGSRVSHLSDSQLSSVKQNPKQFFDTVYGGRYGNASNEGYKYRGRGFNQLTFKGNYKKYAALTGVDIVSNPDKLNDPRVAAKVSVAYFKERMENAPASKRKEYNFSNINSFNTQEDALLAVFNANAGWGKSKRQIQNSGTGGWEKAQSRVGGFYQWLT